MDELTRKGLFEKNARIIEAVKRRAETICPGALDMIAVTGSFASGDFHEKSDLDLLIVISDDAGYALSHCFILEDVGYDLYCHTWERLEHAANYDSPYVSKLLDAQIVYCRDDAVQTRFDDIAARLKDRLAQPLSEADCTHAEAMINQAKQIYFDLVSCDGTGYHAPLIGIVYHLECAVYLLNHAVVRHGVRGICSELAAMPYLPADFLSLHTAVFGEHTYTQAMEIVRNLIQTTAAFAAVCRNAAVPKAEVCADNLRGTYEELVSNYKNKLIRAADQKDIYVSRMTLASAQLFFDEVGGCVALPEFIVFDDAAYGCPAQAVRAFSDAMEQYARVYASCGLDVCRYAEITSFEDAYIRTKTE